MGNAESSPRSSGYNVEHDLLADGLPSFPGSTLVESALQCGKIDDATAGCGDKDSTDTFGKKTRRKKKKTLAAQILSHAENCVMSPQNSIEDEAENSDSDEDNGIRHPDSDDSSDEEDAYETFDHRGRTTKTKKPSKLPPKTLPTNPEQVNKSSSLLAKSLMSEVENPNSMSQGDMAEREKKLLKAQSKARQQKKLNIDPNSQNGIVRPIGSPSEGVGQPSVLGSLTHALTGNFNDNVSEVAKKDPSVIPPNSLTENRAAQAEQRRGRTPTASAGKHTVTIGLSLSRRSSSLGHPDTVTRQTAFDFNELQDREYKYVSSTDSSGWRAGGGEKGSEDFPGEVPTTPGSRGPGTPSAENGHKVAAPDTVHIPIIQIDAESPQVIDSIISALARGEIFIPHMAIIPEALSVNGVSPPDLVVRFGTERNEDLPPDEWPNWCLEFMHNQLYEYFHGMGAQWSSRPFSITLAKKVRWKTVKHMNRYFSHAERVIDAWREKGPQYLDPQLAYIEGGATPEEVARPHGIYLFRNGVPTNYFSPNFHPPYTTKMTRSLLFNVLGKSWDKKRREWSSIPIPKLITPSMLVSVMCGCGDNQASGFIATEATLVDGSRSTTVPAGAAVRTFTPQNKTPRHHTFARREDDDEEEEVDAPELTPLETTVIDLTNSIEDCEQQQVVPTLKLQISSSSVPFVDGIVSESNDGIPSPPYKSFSSNNANEHHLNKQQEQREPEEKQPVVPLQAPRQPLEPKDTTKVMPPKHRRDEENDENSGDSRNHEPTVSKQMGKKKVVAVIEDEEWLKDFETPMARKEYNMMASLNAQRPITVARAQVAPSMKGVDPLRDPFRASAVGPGSPTVRSNNSSKSARNAMIKNTEVGVLSMDYSHDDSTFKSVGDYTFDSTLLGQNFAGDSKSVLSVATKETIATTKDILEELKGVPESTQHSTHSIGVDSSYTSVDDEPIPSDEELFAVGWAKALDANSGNYYYFTLDRKQTVWENPLAPVSPSNSDASSVGEI